MTSAISSFIPPVAPQAPAPSAPSAPPASPHNGFSQMLSRAQAREAEAPQADAAPEAPRPPSAQAAERSKADKAGRADKADKTDKSGQARTEQKTDKTAQAEGEHQATEDEHAEPAADKAAGDPSLAEWLASLQRPTAPHDAAPAKGAAGATDAEQALGTKAGAGRGAGKDLKAQDAAEAARDLQAKAEPATRDAAADSASFKAVMAEAADTRHELKAPHELNLPHTAAAGIAPAHGGARTTDTGATASVQVPTPATSPQFAGELGVQVSVLARDGVQQAELHLNPAEMGPISVQIAIDGTQAQVNFGADSAATRQIIETGLPELAAALRDAGFTLSGGGVHSQARGRDEGGEGRGQDGQGRSAGGASETDVTVRRSQARVSAGGVDLYA